MKEFLFVINHAAKPKPKNIKFMSIKIGNRAFQFLLSLFHKFLSEEQSDEGGNLKNKKATPERVAFVNGGPGGDRTICVGYAEAQIKNVGTIYVEQKQKSHSQESGFCEWWARWGSNHMRRLCRSTNKNVGSIYVEQKQKSHSRESGFCEWWAGWGSNPRPLD